MNDTSANSATDAAAPEGTSDDAAAALTAAQDRLWARLDALAIRTSTTTHPPVFTVDEARALRGSLPGGHCKSLFLRDKKKQFLVVALEDRKVDLKALRGALGAGNLSFGSPERLYAALGVTPGSVTPLALINADPATGLIVALDRGMLDHDLLNYHPLSNDATTAIAPADLVRFVRECGFEPLAIDFEQAPPVAVALP